MTYATTLLPQLIEVCADAINQNAEEVTALDQAIGDGDHVINLQRGIHALMSQRHELVPLDWAAAWQKIGMTLMTTVGGASGSLLGTLFVAMAKAAKGQVLDQSGFAAVFNQGVESMKERGKSDAGEKTMLDVLIPVANYLQASAQADRALVDVLIALQDVARAGVESTRDMLATKGRASFLEARTLGHIDAGAKSSQLIICAICPLLLASPA